MKQTLVLIPGVGGDSDLWQHQINYLQELVDIKVIIVDQQTTRQAMVDYVLKQSPQEFILAGHSLGGWLAQAIAAHAPQRVSKLILIDTWTRADEAFCVGLRESYNRIKAGQRETVLREHRLHIVHPSRLQDEQLLTTIAEMQMRMSAEKYCLQVKAMIDDYESLPLLKKITAKTLMIHGSQDPLFSLEEHQVIQQNIRAGQLAIIEECGHVSPLERPQAVTALMRLWIEM